MLKKLALVVALSGCLMVVKADTVTSINSSASETTNNSAFPTQNITPHPAWAGPFAGSSWVSFANTGDPSAPGFVTVPNGTLVFFSDTFNLSGPLSAASLTVLADDTTSVWVNGTQIFAANLIGPYPTCSATPIGCLTSTEGIFTLADLQPFLNVGSNTISFGVYQGGGSSYGLDYSGTFTSVPEPSTMVLMVCALMGLALVGRRTVLG